VVFRDHLDFIWNYELPSLVDATCPILSSWIESFGSKPLALAYRKLLFLWEVKMFFFLAANNCSFCYSIRGF